MGKKKDHLLFVSGTIIDLYGFHPPTIYKISEHATAEPHAFLLAPGPLKSSTAQERVVTDNSENLFFFFLTKKRDDIFHRHRATVSVCRAGVFATVSCDVIAWVRPISSSVCAGVGGNKKTTPSAVALPPQRYETQ